MKKFLKIVACAVMVLAMAGMMSSCKKDKDKEKQEVSKTYEFKAYGSGLHFNEKEKTIFNQYLAEKGALGLDKTKSYTATCATEEECSKEVIDKAKADFDGCVSKFDGNEVRNLISSGSELNYSWNCYELGVEAGKWECPYQKLGTMTFDSVSKDLMIVSKRRISHSDGTCLELCVDNTYCDLLYVKINDIQGSNVAPPAGDYELTKYETTLSFDKIEYPVASGNLKVTQNGSSYKYEVVGTATKGEKTVNFSVTADNVRFVE